MELVAESDRIDLAAQRIRNVYAVISVLYIIAARVVLNCLHLVVLFRAGTGDEALRPVQIDLPLAFRHHD